MQNKEKNNILKATIIKIMVALIFCIIVLVTIRITCGEVLTKAIALLNIVTVSTTENEKTIININSSEGKLKNYPAYGEKYGELKIESLKVDLPMYYGDTLEILRKGVGHTAGSYFPGEGGSIICMAHDTAGFLKYLYTIETGSKIDVYTDYGKFVYEVYETKIVHQSEVDAVYMQKDNEILMLYTCYPSNSIGHATHRFITYSKLVEKEIY